MNRTITTLFSVAAFVASFMLPACVDEHVEPIDTSLKVGNVYCQDGSIYPAGLYLAQTGLKAVGIVVGVGGPDDSYQALVMGLEDIGRASYYNITDEKVDNVSIDTEAFDGKENTSALLTAAAEDSMAYPEAALLATAYSAGGITGWHLPSVAELRTAAQNRWQIQSTINAIGSEPFKNDWYQTSTADGSSDETEMLYNYCIILPEGRVVSENKNSSHYVRPFLILR